MAPRRSSTTGTSPSARKLDDARGGDDAGSQEKFFVGTDQLPSAMSRGLMHPSLAPQDGVFSVRERGRVREAKVRTDVEMNPAASAPLALEQQEDIVLKMQRDMIRWKQHGAGLLKLHLDLMDVAFTRGSDRDYPEFVYDLREALARQGYLRQERGYHTTTVKNLRNRLAAICQHRVTVWALTDTRVDQTLVARTPYWIAEEYYHLKPTTRGPSVGNGAIRGDGYFAVRIRPGRWWRYARMGQRHIMVPRSVLELQTDGNGNERERIALFAATYLAVHVRRNQRRNAGTRIPLRVGTLLEGAGVISGQRFLEIDGRQAARMREYLHHGSEEVGALPILRRLGAFDAAIRDEDEFFATGHAWRTSFWDTMLDVQIPDLGIRIPSSK